LSWGQVLAFVLPSLLAVGLVAWDHAARPVVLPERGQAVVAPVRSPVSDLPAAPDRPGPVPGPRPPANLFRVVVLYHRRTPTPLDAAPFQDPAVRAYLDAACARNPDGRPDWWVWDVGELGVVPDSATLRAALNRAVATHPRLPWITATGGPGGEYSGPLPDTAAATLMLLKGLGGDPTANR
jgi:hypothetical protein